ncbi:MAG: aquaporin [Ginsengibacter sp.]
MHYRSHHDYDGVIHLRKFIIKKYTRIIAGCFVCIYVIVAGPVSGFGMNPARSFASAFPAHIYTAFWIYMLIPFAGMLSAAELFLFIQKKKKAKTTNNFIPEYFPTGTIKI